MMNDIVEELRAAHPQWTSGLPGCSDCGTHEKCLGQRAADVIEKLRGLLTPIGTVPSDGGIGFIPFSTAVAQALAVDISRACDIDKPEWRE
jgi:hypothetical protein